MFSVTITRFPLKRSQYYKLVEKQLFMKLSLPVSEIDEIMSAAPYTCPDEFESLAEAKKIANSFVQKKCKVIVKNLDDYQNQSRFDPLEKREDPPAEGSRSAIRYKEAVGAKNPRGNRGTIGSAIAARNGAAVGFLQEPRNLQLMLGGTVLLLVGIILGGMNGGDISDIKDGEWKHAKVEQIDQRVTEMVKVQPLQPLKPVIRKLDKWVKKEQFRKKTRSKLSKIYNKRSNNFVKPAVEKKKEKRRSWKLEKWLLVAITFNPKNLRAWDSLIAHYERVGRLDKAEEARQKIIRIGLSSASV